MNYPKGHFQVLKDVEKDMQSMASFSTIGGNEATIFLLKKAEKIAIAFHLITSHLSDVEPIRQEARKTSIVLEGAINSFVLKGENRREGNIQVIESLILSLVSCADILVVSGFISHGNSSIIKRELFLFRDILIQGIQNDIFKKEMIEKVLDVPFVRGIEKKKRTHKPSAKKQTVHEGGREYLKDTPKGHLKDIRVKAIVDALQVKGELSFNDFAEVVPGVSGKTIQRELSTLVLRGIIKKSGDRRWTKYFLPKNASQAAS